MSSAVAGKRFAILLGIVLVVAAVVALRVQLDRNARKEPAAPTWKPGTAAMAALLREIADTADPEPNVDRNNERANRLLAQLGDPHDPNRPVPLRLQAALELLYAGRTQEALEHIRIVKQVVGLNPQAVQPEYKYWLNGMYALAFLRLGEQQNCIRHHNVDSCLIPITGGGIHGNPEGSRYAITYYSWMLERQPDDLTPRWLLNLAYMTLGEYPDGVPEQWRIPESVFASDYDIGRFYDTAGGAGVAMIGLAGGSVMEDFDGDGLLDLMASSWGLRDQLRFFRNNGDGTFTDVTESAGLTGITSGLNLVHADYDNDGDADVLVLRGAWLGEAGRHPNSLLRNNGDWTFTDVTVESGLLSLHPTQTAAWADYDNDGWLDLFIGNETGNRTALYTGESSDEQDVGMRTNVHPCELFRNNGDGTFTDVATEVGVARPGFVKGVAWGDYDNDGLPDLYLSRMGEANVLYHNDGERADGWRFTEVTREADVIGPSQSFPTWFWDFNNDGWLDLYVAAFGAKDIGDIAALYLGEPNHVEPPRLYRNNGDGTFTDVAGGTPSETAQLAMGANYGDLDNDGWPDYYIGNGAPNPRMLLPNRMFRNAGDGTFQDVTTSGGFGHAQKGHGIAFGDIDNDGDQDIYAVMGGAYSGDVFANALFTNPGHGNHWITLRLIGTTSNRAGIGARIRVTVEGPEGERTIHALAGTGGSFGSSSLQQEIGLGLAERIARIEITWPASGTTQVFENVAPDAFYVVREGANVLEPETRHAFALPLPVQQG